MSSEINDLIAAQLSYAAYGAAAPPTGWTPIYKNGIGTSSFTVYTNRSSQIVFAFKGTDSFSEIYSDLVNDGGADWEKMSGLFNAELQNIQNNPAYKRYQIFTDGHSLGGGMAQTAALEYKLSGYGQNSLPIPSAALQDPKIKNAGGLSVVMANWVDNNNTFYESTITNDITTKYYKGDQNLYTNSITHSNTVNRMLPNVYAGAELDAATLGLSGTSSGAGVASLQLGLAEYHAHAVTNVINMLTQVGAPTGVTPAIDADASNAISAASLVATQNDSISTAQDGAIVATETDGAQITETLQSASTDSDTYALDLNGEPNQIVVVTTTPDNLVTVNTEIQSGATVEIPSDISESGITQFVTFTALNETLQLDSSTTLYAVIDEFAPGDTIDLAGVGTATGTLLGPNNVLTVQETGGATVALAFDPQQDFGGDVFVASPDGNGGTDISLNSFTLSDLEIYGTVETNPAERVSPYEVANAEGQVAEFIIITSSAIDPTTGLAVYSVDRTPYVISATGSETELSMIDDQIMESTLPGDITAALDEYNPYDISSTAALVGVDKTGDVFGNWGYAYGVSTYLGGFAGSAAFHYESGFEDNADGVTPISYPGALSTAITGISDDGIVVGQYATGGDSGNNNIGNNYFTYDAGTYTTINFVDLSDVNIYGINDASQVFGSFVNAGVQSGFIDSGGTISTIDVPDSLATIVTGVSDNGIVVGEFEDNHQAWSTFFDVGGDISTATIGLPIGSSAESSSPRIPFLINNAAEWSINNAGIVVDNDAGTATVSFGYLQTGPLTLQQWTPGSPTEPTAVRPVGTAEAYGVDGTIIGVPAVSFASMSVTCYCPGTLIMTDHGEVAVETLAIGERVATLHGEPRPIKWIGHRTYDGRFVAGQPLMLPVCVRRGAIDEEVPARDLWVSPGHAICLDGVLVPAWLLTNGVSIVQAERVDSVTYIHIELADHEIVFAEGCPAESFLDDNCRNQFHNAAEFPALYPGHKPAWGRPCLPRVEDGFHLQAIQRRLAARAGVTPPTERHGPMRGFIDQAGPVLVTGWAQDEVRPEVPVCLDILAGGRRVMRALANRYRADLRAAGLGSGRHSFEVQLPAGVSGRIEVRRSADQAVLALTEAALAVAA